MANRRTQDDSEEKTSEYSVPIFAPVVPPMITSISHEELVKWRGLRREYEAKMRARVRISGENYNLVTQPIKESFSDKLLKAFCTFRLGIKVEDATDEILLDELNQLLGNVKNDDIPDIEALFKSQLRMNMQESDVDARILSYFERFDEIVEENGLEGCFAGPDGEKEKCKRIMASLVPPALKSEVKLLVFWKEKGAATDVKKLYDIVYEKAKEHERHFQQNKRLKREATKRSDEKPKSAPTRSSFRAPPTVDRPASDTRRVGPPAPSAKAKAPLQKSERTAQKPTRKPPSPCPKCQAMHWLNDCTVATEAEKVELRLKLGEDKQKRKVRLKRLGELLPPASRTVTINGVLELPCCPDTGSTYTVMSRSQWEQLIVVDSSVAKVVLDPPIDFDLRCPSCHC